MCSRFKPDGAKVRDARVERDEESDAEDAEDANRVGATVQVNRAEETVGEGPKEVVRRRRGREKNKSKVSGLETNGIQVRTTSRTDQKTCQTRTISPSPPPPPPARTIGRTTAEVVEGSAAAEAAAAEAAAEAETRSRAKRRETPPTSRAFSSPKERVIKETPVSSPITLHPRRKERAKSRTPPTFRAYFSPKEGVNTEKPVSFPLRRKCARLHPPHKKA
jgi:hypothetical protein